MTGENWTNIAVWLLCSAFYVGMVLITLTSLRYKILKKTRVWSRARLVSSVMALGIVGAALLCANTVYAAGTTFATNGSTQIGTFPSSLPNSSFRIDSSTVGSTSITATTANFVGSASATLSPTTGWTQTWSSSADDSNHKISFGFNVGFNGTNYDGVYVGSNTYLTFGSGSNNYSSLSASNPAIPGVHMCAADNSYQRVWYKLDSAGVMRIRYEGTASTGGTPGSPNIVYEAVFYSGQSYFDVHMGVNARCGGDTTAPTVTNVTSDKPNGTYKAGDVIDIDVTFSETVTSTGNVTVTLETGATDRTCTFTVTSATTGTCNYTVQAGDTSADLTVNSVSGTIRDTANNALSNTTPTTNLAANKALVIDTTGPTVSNVTSSLANGSYKSGQVVPVQVVFNESVTVAGGTPQLVIVTGSPATTTLNYSSGTGSNTLVFNYTVAGTNYSSDLDHASTTALSLNGATIKDSVGNNATLTLASPGASGSLAANKAIVIDNTAPTVSISSTASSLTNAAIPVTVTFSESVTGFVVGDISVTNGTAGSFSGSGASYTFSVTPSSQGAVSISIAGSVAQDTATNANTASNTLNYTYDSVAPTVAITTSVASPTLQTPIPFTATFSEAVTGMSLSDVSVTSGTAGNFVAVSSTVYTFDVSPTGHPVNNVEVYVNIAASSAQDAAGNNNTAANSGTPYNIRFDNHSPTVALTTSAGEPTNSSSMSVTATFSESVTGFVVGDLNVTNGSAGSFSGSGTTYTFTVTPSSQGPVTIQVPASVAQDGATNQNLISNLLTRTYDSTAPTVALTTGASSPSNASTFDVTATFNESVTGFVVGDLSLSNGSASNFTGSGTTYTFTVTASGQGAVTVQVPAARAADAATNNNTVSNTISITYDSAAPTLAEVTPVNATTTDATPNYTFSSNEAGTISYGGDCTSATTSASSGNNTITFATLSDGLHNNCAIVVTDALGNVSSPLVVTAFSIDGTAPDITSVVLSDTSLTIGETALVTITFTEAVNNFDNTDVTTIDNGTLSAVSSEDGITWTATFTPTNSVEDNTNIITVTESGITDTAGNSGIDKRDSANYVVDTLRPTITSVNSDKANGSYKVGEVIDVDLTFSEAVGTVGDLTVTLETGTDDRSCVVTISLASTGTCNYTVQSGDTTSDLTVKEISGTVVDAYSNAMSNFTPTTNLAANKALVIDTTAPTISEVTPISSPTSDSTPSYSFTTNEAGTISYGGSCSSATTSANSGSNTITFSALSDGVYTNCTVTISDAATNASNTLTLASFTVDATAPAASTLSPADNATGVSTTANLILTFQEAVTVNSGNIVIRQVSDDAAVETIAVTSDQVSGSGTTTIIINPSVTLASETSYYVTVPNTAFRDAVSNSYVGLTTNSAWNFTTSDVNAPTIVSATSSAANGSYKIGDTIPIELLFSEAVSGSATVILETGITDRSCTVTVSAASVAICAYVVQAGDNSLDLSISNITGSIADVSGNPMTDYAPTTSLVTNKDLLIDGLAPTAPGTPTLSGAASPSPTWAWTASTDTGSGLAALPYVIEWSTSPSFASTVSSAAVATTTFTHSTPLTSGTWYVRILARDAVGNVSAYSSMASLVVGGVPGADLSLVDLTTGGGKNQKIVLDTFVEFAASTGKKLELGTGQVVYFTVNDNEHTATITEISDEYVTFVLASTPKTARLKVGETGRYDVDDDGDEDVEVTVLGVDNGIANLTFKRLYNDTFTPAVTTKQATKPSRLVAVAALVLTLGAIVGWLVIGRRSSANGQS